MAQTFKVRVRGERMQLPSVVPVSLADPAGANHWSMDSFELTVVVKGSQPILIRQLPMVRISMALEMDIETFLTTPTATFTTGLAFALQLDPSTIRVTGYRSRGNRRRSLTDASGGRGGIDLTFAVIPAEALQDSPPPPPAAPPPPPLAPGEAAGTPVAEDSDVIVFDPTSVRALSEAVAAATAALQEIDIAGVTVATSSLVTEVQEPVAAECSPPCKVRLDDILSWSSPQPKHWQPCITLFSLARVTEFVDPLWLIRTWPSAFAGQCPPRARCATLVCRPQRQTA